MRDRGVVGARRSCRSVRGGVRHERSTELSAVSSSATGSRSRGKIDRIDVETFGARGIVQDYKSGRTAHSAAADQQEQRLQIPLYMLVLRDLVGIEPLGGLYRPLAGERKPRGLLRASAKEELPGFTKDGLPRRRGVLGAARDGTRATRGRSRSGFARGDVKHDPRGGSCPTWCDLLADVPGEATRDVEQEQQAAVDARAASSSPPARAPARRRCSSSASRARSARTGSTSTRSS